MEEVKAQTWFTNRSVCESSQKWLVTILQLHSGVTLKDNIEKKSDGLELQVVYLAIDFV